MIKKISITLLISASLAVFSQCSAGYVPPSGSLYTSVKMNKDVSTKTSVNGKVGEACATGILGIIATGDASVKAAAANGKIGTVAAVDYSSTAILGSLYTKTCTLAVGD